MRNKSDESSREKLVPFTDMNVEELQVLAHAVVAPEHQEKLHTLLAKNQSDILSADEQATLDKLLAEADQVALFKARALYTLKILPERR
jgi:hypothetical protein